MRRNLTSSTKLSMIVAASLLLAAVLRSGRAAEPHWAYQSPQRPPLPSVADEAWFRQPVDAFVAARLDREKLLPSAAADPHTLLRRATLALTGLPPALDEIEAFVADPSPDAYERLIDRLLASPRYGERMAVEWLDLARYADTHGYHSDSERVMWPWRDWVIDAFNAGMPFDQFTIEQLAGDLLPNPTLSQRVATGLHRNHMLNDENGAIPGEYLAEYVADRVATTGTIWLGQTLACARCHDHKYDPITQREFYGLYAFFHNVPENGLGGKTGNSPPTLVAPTKLQQAQLVELDARIASLESTLAKRAASAAVGLMRWEEQLRSKSSSAATQVRPPADALAHFRFDEAEGAVTKNAVETGRPGQVKGNSLRAQGRFGSALFCDGQTHVEVPGLPNWNSRNAFSLATWAYPTTADRMAIVGRVDEAQARRGFELALARGHIVFRLTHVAGEDEIEVRSAAPLEQQQWQHVVATYDGSGSASGIAIYLGGGRQTLEVTHDKLRGHIQGDQLLTIGRGDSQTFFRGMIDEVRLFDRALRADEVAAVAGGDPIQGIQNIPAAQRSAEQTVALTQHYLKHHDSVYAAADAELSLAKSRREAVLRAAPAAMVMEELLEPRPTHIFERGLYDRPGERVFAGTPSVWPPLRPGLSKNRLGLARWLIDPQNPLTSRVVVNRTWQTLLGAGLVRTPEDFGTRGERPTHRELLDWLAVEFGEGPKSKVQSPKSNARDPRGISTLDLGPWALGSAWDHKRLVRIIVTSTMFRQESRVRPELAERDPDNRLWARGPRFRLPAEAVRDQALAAAGLLESRLGGPSVKPYQPAELWRELAYDPNDYSAQVFVQSHGADLYRRSLYTFWKRSAPPPNLSIFDAPDRETCTASRGRSNSPLGALVLLNDTTFVEAARKLAERVMHEAEGDAKRIDRLILHVLSRPATARETELLKAAMKSHVEEFRRDSAAAANLLAVGESPVGRSLDVPQLAAWTMIASTVLNLDEAVTLR